MMWGCVVPRRSLFALALTLGMCVVSEAPAIAQSAVSEALIPYAPIKRPAQPIFQRYTWGFVPPELCPARGVVETTGSGLSNSGRWTIVDFDTRMFVRFGITVEFMPDNQREIVINSRAGRKLTIGELNKIIAVANADWDPPPPDPAPDDRPRMVPVIMDYFSELLLYDGNDVLTASAKVQNAIDDIKIPRKTP